MHYWRADISSSPPTVEYEAMRQDTGMSDLLAKIVCSPTTTLVEVELMMTTTAIFRVLFCRQHASNTGCDPRLTRTNWPNPEHSLWYPP